MSQKENKEKIFDRIKKKRRLIFLDEKSYEQRWSTQLSILNILTLLGLFTLVVVVFTYLIFAFTPASYFIPGTKNQEYYEMSVNNKNKADSLQRIVTSHEQYINRIQTIILGKDFKEDTMYQAETSKIFDVDSLQLEPSKEDSLFREAIENQSLPKGINSKNVKLSSTEGIFFYSPIVGTVSRSFSPSKNHLGVDIVAKKNTIVKSPLEGKVLYSGFTISDGNFIILSHNNSIVTIFKHNSELLVEIGDLVKAGDPIAVVGNTGENSTGYHVHFEIWNNGHAVNPEKYISFE